MERLTDRKTAADLKSNYEGLRAAGMPRDIGTERYIKLAGYEDIEELFERLGTTRVGWQVCIIKRLLEKKKVENKEEETTGEWVYRDGKMGETWYCSLCGAPVVYDILEEPFLSKFCPECGKKMKKR